MSDKASFEMLMSLGQKKKVVEEFGPKKNKIFKQNITHNLQEWNSRCA
jgi:hypothetical protein